MSAEHTEGGSMVAIHAPPKPWPMMVLPSVLMAWHTSSSRLSGTGAAWLMR